METQLRRGPRQPELGLPPSVSRRCCRAEAPPELNPSQGSAEVARAAGGPLCGLAVFREPRGWKGTPRSVASAGIWPLAPARGCWAGRFLPLLALATSGQWALPAPPRFKRLSRCPARPGAVARGRGAAGPAATSLHQPNLGSRGGRGGHLSPGCPSSASERGRRGMNEMGKPAAAPAKWGRGAGALEEGSPSPASRRDCSL